MCIDIYYQMIYIHEYLLYISYINIYKKGNNRTLYINYITLAIDFIGVNSY